MSESTEFSTPHDQSDKKDGAIQRLPDLGLRLSERKVLLALVDMTMLFIALYLALNFDDEFEFTGVSLNRHLSWFLVLALLWFVTASLLNVYDLAKAAIAPYSMWSAGSATLLTTAVYLLIPYITPTFPERRSEVFIFVVVAVLGVTVWRLIYASLLTQPSFHQKAMVIGAGLSGRNLAEAVAVTEDDTANPYSGTGYRLVGFIDDDPDKLGQTIGGVPVIGNRNDLVSLVKAMKPDELIVAIVHSALIHDELFDAILQCRELGIPITRMTDLYERMTGTIPVMHAGRDLDVVLPMSRPSGFRLYLALSRLFDIAIGLIGCATLAVIIPFIWLANRLTDPGDVFYRQVRVGKGGNPFHILKFRSMIMDAEKSTGVIWAQEDDPRITLVGKFLRKTRLDEFPQFWNVLHGNMTLIGPRPERPQFVEELAAEIPFYRIRHAVKPGITGWAQVKYRYGASVDDALVKLQYDLYYIKNQGPFLDFSILLKTVQVVLGFKGR